MVGAPGSLVILFCFFNSGLWGYWHSGHSWPIVPASGDSEDDDCGEADGMWHYATSRKVVGSSPDEVDFF
jgi:hypothetical protein